MRTDALISLLAADGGPAPPPRDALYLGLAIAGMFPFLVAMVTTATDLVPMRLWPESATLWKIGYAAALATAGLWLLRRAGRPGATVRWPLVAIGALLSLGAAAGTLDWFATPPGLRMARLIGHSALVCPVAILAISVPVLLGVTRAMRGTAPVRPALAGMAAGLIAGGVAAIAYGLACTEGALSFVAVWYSLGVLLSAALGAAAGRYLLRW